MVPKSAASKAAARKPGEPTTGGSGAAGSDEPQQGSARYRAQEPEVLAGYVSDATPLIGLTATPLPTSDPGVDRELLDEFNIITPGPESFILTTGSTPPALER